MRYLKFRICNFKGIKDTQIDLDTLTGANVFALVGLNESGKTTILEAIHSFSPDHRTGSLRGTEAKSDADAAKERLPRHLLARFTGDITVQAMLLVSAADKQQIARTIFSEAQLTVKPDSIPDKITLTRADVFNRGDYVETKKTFDFDISGKKSGDRKDKTLSETDYGHVYHSIWSHTPDIAYHDSFIFNFPKRIYLTSRQGVSDWVYRKMFEDVLAAGRVPYELEDITRRIKSEKYKKSWLEFFTSWSQDDEKDQVQQVIDQASETITSAVFGKWNKIFKEDAGDKEISVQHGVERGRIYNREARRYDESDSHDFWISLEIKHGTRRFPIQDRSLGFRWFFAFLLFTQFRTKRGEDRPVLFLFDEPAANLHSAAQERLIESFPEIATGDNMLMYSTHSHYMISPDWLEQTFIVTNSADTPDGNVVNSAVSGDESLDVKAELYRSFVNAHPSETSYFQPIIDRIEVTPSKFDSALPTVVVEGKSDFYILRYAQELLKVSEPRILPATGSGTFGALIAIGATWGTKFVFLLDSDNAGSKERARYALDHGARKEALSTLGDFNSNIKEIEDIVDGAARSIISSHLNNVRVTKKIIGRFFQEQLAKREIISLGNEFEKQSKALLASLQGKLNSL